MSNTPRTDVLISETSECLGRYDYERLVKLCKELETELNTLANRVLYCDYGDNERSGIGWGIRHDLRNGYQFMFGPSISEALKGDSANAASGDRPKGEGK